MQVGRLYGLPKANSERFVCFRHCECAIRVNEDSSTKEVRKNEAYYLLISEDTLLVYKSSEYPFLPLKSDEEAAKSIIGRFIDKRAERIQTLEAKETARKELIERMKYEYLFLKERLDLLNQDIKKLQDVTKFNI